MLRRTSCSTKGRAVDSPARHPSHLRHPPVQTSVQVSTAGAVVIPAVRLSSPPPYASVIPAIRPCMNVVSDNHASPRDGPPASKSTSHLFRVHASTAARRRARQSRRAPERADRGRPRVVPALRRVRECIRSWGHTRSRGCGRGRSGPGHACRRERGCGDRFGHGRNDPDAQESRDGGSRDDRRRSRKGHAAPPRRQGAVVVRRCERPGRRRRLGAQRLEDEAEARRCGVVAVR